MDSTVSREFIKALLSEGGIAIVAIYALMDAYKIKGRRIAAVALFLLASVAVAAYFEFGVQRFDRYMNPHDVYHYYLGSKYADELGYNGLYESSLIADREIGAKFTPSKSIRDLDTHGYVPARNVFRDADEIKARFTPERWEEFKGDVDYFRSIVSKSKWEIMLRDKGYNGTPVWSAAAAMFASQVPTSSPEGMLFISILDPILLGLMFIFVGYAFGPRALFIALLFFGTNFTMHFVHSKGGFLRLDWVACAIISMCLVKTGRYKTAGAVFAYAAAARIFPLIFAFGLGAIGLWELLYKRTINRQIAGFFIVLALVMTALIGVSTAVYGVDHWEQFLDKMSVHNEDISTNRVGFKYVFTGEASTGPAKRAMFEENQTAWWIIQAIVLALTFAGATRLKPYEAMGLGFVPVYFMTAPTFYYYVMLIVPLLMFLPDFSSLRKAAGIAFLFAFSVAAYILHQFYPLEYALCYFISAMLLVYAVFLIFYSVGVPELARFIPQRPAVRVSVSVLVGVLVGVAVAYWYFDRSGGTLPKIQWGGRVSRVEVTPTVTVRDVRTTPAARTVTPSVPPRTAQPDEVRLVFAGDVMLSRGVHESVKDNNRDFTYPFAKIAPFVRDSDVAFCNLECPVSGRGEAIEKRYLFNAPPESVAGLVHARFDLVSLANNHILDYGLVAMDDTMAHLDKAGVKHAGIVTNDAPQEPVLFERNGIKIGFLAYSDPESSFGYAKEFLEFDRGPAKGTPEAMFRDIALLRERCDVVVVSIHWGTEYKAAPDPQQRKLGRYAIDQGAHIVAGHHPHVQQPIEKYKNGIILYSLGNLVFDQTTRPPTRESRLVRIAVTKAAEIRAVEILDATIRPRDWVVEPKATAFTLWDESASVNTTAN